MGPNRIILLKSWTNHLGKVYPMGTVLQVDNELGSELIENKVGEKYNGEYPPKEKQKTEFFKPK